MDKYDELKSLIDTVDSDSEVGLYIVEYILENGKKIDGFLKKHKLDKLLYFPIGTIFYLVNIPDDARKETKRFKDNKFRSKYLKQTIALMHLKDDKELKKLLKIDEKDIDELLERNEILQALPKPKRYNDKTIFKEKLEHIFYILSKAGKGQTEQINIIMDLFQQEDFEDYKSGWTQARYDRIRKLYQEPAIKKMRSLYGK